MNPKRRDSNHERRSPDVYSTSSAASSTTKNTNSNRAPPSSNRRMNLQDCLREMNSVMRVLDNTELNPLNRIDDLSTLFDNVEPRPEYEGTCTPEVESVLQSQRALLKRMKDCNSQLSILEQQYEQVNEGIPSRLPFIGGQAGSREMNAAVRVCHDANALVERLRAQVEQAAQEYQRTQDPLEGMRSIHRETYDLEEDVFERGDPNEGDAPVSDDNKMNSQSNPRFIRRKLNGCSMSAPYTAPCVGNFEFPDLSATADIEDKVRELTETKHQIDALRGMITKFEGMGTPVPSKLTPRPVPLYPNVNAAQQRRRQQLHEINRSLNSIETFINREQLCGNQPKRNHSVSENTLVGARPRFNSCNVQPWDNYPLPEVPFRAQPRSLTEVATWGGSSSLDNSDNGEVQSEGTDSEIERLAQPIVPPVTGARSKVRQEPVDSVEPKNNCDHCVRLGAYTQMLTLSLVQANDVISGQQKEIERLKAFLRTPVEPRRDSHPLNNQVTPGVRANNYVDNLKSFSTLNFFTQPVERKPSTPRERNVNREEERKRRPNKNSMNQNNFSKYASNPELHHEGTSTTPKATTSQLSRERLEMQPAVDAATVYLSSKEGELCTPDILIQTCRCLLDQLTPAGVSHKHILRILQPTLGQFLARPVEPTLIMESLTNVLQKELASLTKEVSSPTERGSVFDAGVSGISDRSTAGNDQPEDADGISGGGDAGEDMAEADRGNDDKEGATGGFVVPIGETRKDPYEDEAGQPTGERLDPEDD